MSIQTVNKGIVSIGNSEKNVKQRVPAVVTDMFQLYVDGGQAATNVALANRLLEKLSPANKALVLSVFRVHLPFSYDEETGMFGKMLKGKRAKGRIEKMQAYIDDCVCVWDFAISEKKETVKVSRAEKVQKSLTTALNAKNDPLTVEQLAEVLKRSGVSVSELVARLTV